METSTPSCSWTFLKTSVFHTKEELMETTFGYVYPYMAAAALKEFLEAYGPVLVP